MSALGGKPKLLPHLNDVGTQASNKADVFLPQGFRSPSGCASLAFLPF